MTTSHRLFSRDFGAPFGSLDGERVSSSFGKYTLNIVYAANTHATVSTYTV